MDRKFRFSSTLTVSIKDLGEDEESDIPILYAHWVAL
jgi:hypothetical protein